MSYPELLIDTDNNRRFFTPFQIGSNILSCFKINRSIHPIHSVVPEYSEFLEISSHRRIRILRVKPYTKISKRIFYKRETEDILRNSRLSGEEYWFTRWNKSLQNGNCNCSFRRSQRFLKDYDRRSLVSNRSSGINCNNSMLINKGNEYSRTQLECYVEKLLCDILVAAFTEYSVLTTKSRELNVPHNIHNLFINVKDELNQSDKVQNDNFIHVSEHQTRLGKKCRHAQKKTKPMILLLHGIGSSAEIWWDVMQYLVSAGHEVVAPDMLGHGYSSVPDCSKSYHFSSLLKDTITVFDKYVSCTELEQCIVIGHSFGCSLASALARYREQQVVQLILISGGGPTPLAPPVSSTEDSVFGCLQILMKPFLFCGVKRTMFYSSRGKHFDVCDSTSAVPSYVLRYISEGQNWPEGDAAFHRRILIPTLLVHGLQDTVVTLVQECEMERTIPRSFLEIIPTAGHQAMVETPEQLCHMLLCFIEWWSK